AGRVTPQHINNFLSMPNRTGMGGLNGTNIRQVSHIGGQTNINNSFNRINNTQINRINNNLNNSFNHFHHNHGFRSGFGFFGFPFFGFGWGSPFWNNWGFGVRSFWNPWGYWGLFGPRFWATNYCYFPWYRSYYYGAGYPYSYWWGTPTWAGLNSWFPNY